MSNSNIPILGDIQETMLGPLWARATYSKLYPEILNDPKAAQIIKEINYDFAKTKEFLDEWRALGLLVRAKSFDVALKNYIEHYPNSSIVNIGAGLDTTFYRVDNGTIKWYDLDLPNAIQFRRKFLSETSRNIFIAKSALDYSWFNEIEFSHDRGVFFIAGGFVYYFKEYEIAFLLSAMAERFPGGGVVFDCISKLAVKIGNKRAKKRGFDGKIWHLAIGNPVKQISQWSNKIKVVDWFTIWARTQINNNWSKKTRKMIKLTERLKTAKIVQIKFV